MGPFFLIDLLGLDTVLHVAEHLAEQYESDRFYVHQGMKRLVGEKQLGAKTGGSGFYKDGEPQIEGDAEPPADLPDRMALKAVLEACLLLEEGVAVDARDRPRHDGRRRHGPAPRDHAAAHEGRHHRPGRRCSRSSRASRSSTATASSRRRSCARLVGQGRLGMKSGQGFFPWPRADEGWGEGPVQLETRGDIAIAWLNNPPANSLSPDVIRALEKVWERGRRQVPRAGHRLGQPAAVLRRRRHQGVHDDRRGRRPGAARPRPRPVPLVRAVLDGDDRRGQRDRLRRRLRAGDGVRRAHRRRLGGLRPARDQPRDHPRLRRHPAAAAAGGRRRRRWR